MTKEEFLLRASKEWDKIMKKKSETDNFYDYEKDFEEIWVEFGRQSLEGSIGDVGIDRRKKKSTESVWEN